MRRVSLLLLLALLGLACMAPAAAGGLARGASTRRLLREPLTDDEGEDETKAAPKSSLSLEERAARSPEMRAAASRIRRPHKESLDERRKRVHEEKLVMNHQRKAEDRAEMYEVRGPSPKPIPTAGRLPRRACHHLSVSGSQPSIGQRRAARFAASLCTPSSETLHSR
jgi:hypothetical protein